MSSFFKHQPKFKPQHKKQQPTLGAPVHTDHTATVADKTGYHHHQQADHVSSPDAKKERHCPCILPDSGAMLGCENDDCPYQWFHPECLGILRMPEEDEAWYCPECRDTEAVREKIRRLEEYGENIGEAMCARVNLDGVIVMNQGKIQTKTVLQEKGSGKNDELMRPI